MKLPRVLGGDVAGVVAECGDRVTKVRPWVKHLTLQPICWLGAAPGLVLSFLPSWLIGLKG